MSQKHLRSTTEKLSSAEKTANGYSSAKDQIGTSAGTREELCTGDLTNLFRGFGREIFP